MKQTIFSNWNFFRVVRLLAAIAIIVQAYLSKDIVLGIAGVMFGSMAIFNVGCCGVNGCATPIHKNTNTSKEISY
jgi:Na+/alanine symporter